MTKKLVVYERATVHREQLHDLARVDGSVRRERLAVAAEGHVDVVEEPADESRTTRPAPAIRNPM